jgi:hypothetical protein
VEAPYQTRKRYPKRAFSRVRAGGSLNPGVYTKDGEVSKGASLSDLSLGKRLKEPRFFFSPTFQKEESGFYSFSGFELRGVPCKKS